MKRKKTVAGKYTREQNKDINKYCHHLYFNGWKLREIAETIGMGVNRVRERVFQIEYKGDVKNSAIREHNEFKFFDELKISPDDAKYLQEVLTSILRITKN